MLFRRAIVFAARPARLFGCGGSQALLDAAVSAQSIGGFPTR